MPNLINQMRNGQMPQTQPQPLDNSINQVRGMMNWLQHAQNPESALKQMIANNPQFGQIAAMMKANPNGLEGVARQMARERGIDLNDLIQKLQGAK